MPASELFSQDVDAGDVAAALQSELSERVSEAGTWQERFAVVDEMLLARAGGGRAMSAVASAAWGLLTSGRSTSVAGLAEACGWSDRHIFQQFRAEMGLTPKAAARVVRFDRARRVLQRRAAATRPLDLAGLAAECGYFDQSHMAREFRDLAGCSPSTLVHEEFRFIQAAGGPPLPESDS